MNNFDDLITAHRSPGIDTLERFDKQRALDAGIEPAVVQNWKLVHEAYYGDGLSSKKQRKARDRARGLELSIGMLALIERAIKHISHATRRHSYRMKMLSAAGPISRTCAALTALAKRIVPAKEKEPPRERVTFGVPKGGKCTMTLTTDEHFMADLKHAVSQGLDPSRPAAPQMAAAVVELLRGGGGVPEAAPRPLLLVGLADHVKIMAGEGDEITLGLTNGTTITGAEYLNRFVATGDNHLEAAIFHPTEGAVNLYKTQRFANQKQRDLARATMPVCSYVDCHQAADLCEIHHITAWSRGGETNLSNLAPLCRYHNRVNDDDPSRASRGRIEMIGGTPTWVSPRGYEVVNSRHPYGAMQTIYGPKHRSSRQKAAAA